MRRVLRRASFAVLGVLLVLAAAVTALRNVRPDVRGYPLQPLGVAVPDAGDAPASPLRVTFLGVSTLLFDDGQTQVMTDGFFSRPRVLALALPLVPDTARIAVSLAQARVTRLAAVIPLHSHYDHAMDAPVVAGRTGALLVGSASTANLGRGYGLPETSIREAVAGEPMRFGRFTVTLIESAHVPSYVPVDGTIDAPLGPPARSTAYRMGASYSAFIEHDGRAVLVLGSAGYSPGALRGRDADVVYLAVALLGEQDDEYREAYWREVVEAVGARRVIPIHWDDFFRPISEPLRPLPRLFDDVGNALRFLARRGAAAGVDVVLPVAWAGTDPFAGLDPDPR